MCRRDEQCASGHCTFPWGWTTGTCSQCKKQGDCPRGKVCKETGGDTGTDNFNANRKRNLCVSNEAEAKTQVEWTSRAMSLGELRNQHPGVSNPHRQGIRA